jgi:hypothetical protein
MRSRPLRTPVEIIILSASTLLGVMAGIGVAYLLWERFNQAPDGAFVCALILVSACLVSLVVAAIGKLSGRLFVVAVWAALVVSFFVGSGLFATL